MHLFSETSRIPHEFLKRLIMKPKKPKELNRNKTFFLSCVLLSFLTNLSFSQNVIPKFGKEDRSLKINGGIRLMSDIYAYSGIAPRRDGFQFRVQARLNLSLLGIEAPFAFNFSEGNQNFKLPSYTFTGISPKYKIATLHVGDRSMFFSRYTLGNITFRGVGLELNPGKFYVGGMYGRLRRAVAEDLDGRQNLDPSYKRMGYAVKAGYAGEKSKLALILFGANDDENSILQPTNMIISPNSNMVASIQAYQKISNRININLDWAHSLFNRDTRAVSISDEGGFSRTYGGIFSPNASFQEGDAFNTRLNYSGKNYGINFGYERITRGFRTLGAIFFNNDLENITAGFTKSWLKGKLNLAINGGVERTNLDEFVAEKTARIIASGNLNYAPSEKWNYSAQYSNFQNSTKLRAVNNQELFVDSIFLAQVTQAATFTATHMMGENGNGGSITGMLSFQNANSIIEDVITEDQKSNFWYGSMIYRAPQKETFGWGASLSVNRSTFSNITSTFITPSFLADKSFLNEKLKTDARLSVNYISQVDDSKVLLNFGLGAQYEINKDNNLRLSSNIIQQFGSGTNEKRFFEAYINVTYGYKFRRNGIKKKQ